MLDNYDVCVFFRKTDVYNRTPVPYLVMHLESF
jgi:hypothetical protein